MNATVPFNTVTPKALKLRSTVRQLVHRQALSDKNRILSTLARSLQNLALNPV